MTSSELCFDSGACGRTVCSEDGGRAGCSEDGGQAVCSEDGGWAGCSADRGRVVCSKDKGQSANAGAGARANAERLMLYYHFPFCVSKCAYCAFYSVPNAPKQLVDEYVRALIRQTEGFENTGSAVGGSAVGGSAEGHCGEADPAAYSVYFGGGTPTVAGAENLAAVLDAVRRRFRPASGTEITVEANPGTVGFAGLEALKKAGFNRLSLGAQSFNDATLRLLGRAHTAADFVSCFKDARRAGFDNISADLIFALPGEDLAALLRSLRALISLEPEHISVYGLSLEEGTPLWNIRKSLSFPDEDEEERLYFALCGELAKAGYLHYEISNFAKAGFESRHNTGYWERVPYFGFGAAAHSFYKNRRFCAPRDIGAYIERSRAGFLAPTDFESASGIGRAEAEEERVMLGLRLAKGIACEKPVPEYLFASGLAERENGRLRLTEKGFRVSNAVIAKLLSLWN